MPCTVTTRCRGLPPPSAPGSPTLPPGRSRIGSLLGCEPSSLPPRRDGAPDTLSDWEPPTISISGGSPAPLSGDAPRRYHVDGGIPGMNSSLIDRTSMTPPSLYRRILGAQFDALPEVLRRFHEAP